MQNLNIKNKIVNEEEVLYHVGLSKNIIEHSTIAILPGDPGRVEKLAKILDGKAKFLGSKREYTSYLANINKNKVLIMSTGMGGPSCGIAVEELAMLGIKKFIRVGTCGTLQEQINIGDLIVTTGAVRLDGTSKHYAPIEYPAISSFELNNSILDAATALKEKVYFGVTGSSDTFYPGQNRYDNYSGYIINSLQNTISQWRNLNVLNFEMESAALLTICSVFGLKATCICAVMAKRVDSETININKYDSSINRIMNILKIVLS